MPKIKLHWQIVIALVLAVIAGSITGTDMGAGGFTFYNAYEFVGTLFLNALKMLIVPLIASSIIIGIAGMSGHHALGRMGGKTILYYATTSLIAILIGLTVVNIMTPGIVDGQPAKDMIGLSSDVEDIKSKVEGKSAGDVAEVFLRMVPTNIVFAAANGQMLGLIFFSLLFGFFMTKIEHPGAETIYNFWDAIYNIMML